MTKIGLLVGSFNPFHVGHQYVLEQALELFDKVVVVQATNFKKETAGYDISRVSAHNPSVVTKVIAGVSFDVIVGNVEVEYADFKDAEVTIVRGIRDSTDLIQERNYITWVKALGVDNKFIHILTPPELQHVSSSAIRELIAADCVDVAMKYII